MKMRLSVAVALTLCVVVGWPGEIRAQTSIPADLGSTDFVQDAIDALLQPKYKLKMKAVRDYSEGVHQPLLRKVPARFRDFAGTNPREVSNRLCTQVARLPNAAGTTDAVWAWGQFLDHDMSLTETSALNGLAIIRVRDLDNPLSPMIPFTRSNFVTIDGQREQINEITHFIDGSNVYGSDPEFAKQLKGSSGTLRMSDNQLMPVQSTEFLAGDIRANENLILTSLHTLFVREHNRLAKAIAARSRNATDLEIYQLARKIVGAELQLITYQEFLPALLGESAPALKPDSSNKHVDPRIANEFSGALFRMGHSMLSSDLMVGRERGMLLRDAFMNPQQLVNDPGLIDLLLEGLAQQPHQEIDLLIVEDVRSFLFGRPGFGGMDLASLNIQRGRDHGLPDYNTARQAYGLSPVTGVSQMTSNLRVQQDLLDLFGSVDEIDLWIGGLAEDHAPGAQVGPLLQAALIDQFSRLRDGDRLFVTRDQSLRQPLVRAVIDLDDVTLGKIIRWNTNAEVPDDVFHLPRRTRENRLVVRSPGRSDLWFGD